MIRGILFDLDGTLYRGSESIKGAAEAISACRKLGFQVRFFTNNSGISEDNLVQKLTRLGFAPAPGEVFAIGPMSIDYCVSIGCRSVFVVGEPDLVQGFHEAGILCQDPEGADAVVAGICRSFCYDQCNQAMQAILNGARFIATNRDATYPLENGRLQPGAGAIIAAIETASGQIPTVLGKPNSWAIEKILGASGWEAIEMLVVGDRLDSDIAAADAAGCPSVLVRTGVPQPEGKVETLDSVANLPEWLQSR